MTDIIVPSELIERLKAAYPLRSTESGTIIHGLVSLLPAPPKVGDRLTAAQIKELPDSAVMRDNDGDVLVKVGETVRRVTSLVGGWSGFAAYEWPEEGWDRLATAYNITLVSLPKESSK